MTEEALFLFADNDHELNTSLFRVMIPAKALAHKGHKITTRHYQDIEWDKVPDVVLLERLILPPLIEQLRLAGARRIIGTFDDHYALMPQGSPARFFWKGQNLAMRDFYRGLKMVDVSVVPSLQLLMDYGKYGVVGFMPNFHDPELWPQPECRSPEVVVIGWGGSHQHKITWQGHPLTQALAELTKREDVLLHIHCSRGVVDAPFREHGVRHTWTHWLPFREWCATVRGFDIGLAPLKGEYDRRRSNLKVLEYGLAGIPWIANSGGPYETAHGGILLPDNARWQDWYEHLKFLVEEPAVRQSMGGAGRAWAEHSLMDRNVHKYETLLWD